MKDTKYHIGDIIGDYEIIEIIKVGGKRKYKIQCKICNRQKIVDNRTLNYKRAYHSFCQQEIDKSSYFYRKWATQDKNKLKIAGVELFVDFYDKYYKQYLEVKNLANTFSFKLVNDRYQFVPYIKNDFVINEINNKIKVGDIIDDLEILEIIPIRVNKYKYKCCCKICKKEIIINDKIIRKRIYTLHKTHSHNKDLERFKDIWRGIRDRTTNVNSRHYKYYGEVGINSDEFKIFADFYNLMFNDYIDAVKKWPNEIISIDRINSKGNYCKANCRWIPMKFQNGNKKTNKWVCIFSKDKKYITKNISSFCTKFCLKRREFYKLLNNIRKSPYQGWQVKYININDYKDIPFINDINAIIDITDINNPININPI